MKRLLATALALALCFTTGCGKKQDKNINDELTTEIETEETTEDVTEDSFETTQQTTVKEETTAKQAEKEVNITVQSVPQNKNNVKNNVQEVNDKFKPNDSGSPIDSVSGEVYKAVSKDVRSYANSPTHNVESLKSKTQSLYRLSNDAKFAQTGYELISSGAELADINSLINANSDKISQENKSLYADIKEDLDVNVEIFLNMDDISTIDSISDFTCKNEISKLSQNIKTEIGE